MRLHVQRDELLKPLQQVIGVVERRQTLPILGHVLLRADGGRVTFAATDLEVELIATVEMEVAENGEITLPARKTLDIVRSLPEGRSLDLKVRDGQAELRSGRSRFTLAPLSPTDFPSLESTPFETELAVSQRELRRLMERTQFAMAQQDVRFYLNGMYWETQGEKMISVATDGHRLAYSELADLESKSEGVSVIVPRKGVHELARLLDDEESTVTLRLGAGHVQAMAGNVRFTSRLIDGRFPDYRRVLPKPVEQPAVVDRASLRESLGRVSILSNEKFRGVRLRFESEQVEILAHNPENEEAEEILPLEYRGDPIEIGFNVVYLMDALGAMDGERVRIHLHDSNSSALLEDPDDPSGQYVVMPMRL